MIKLIKKYKNFSYEKKIIFSTKFSIFFNAVMALGKIFLSFFQGVFFLVAGIINIFLMTSKLQCYLGIKYPDKKSFKFRNIMTGIFLMLAGLEYSIYMTRMVFTDISLMKYDMFLGIMIAFISFFELGIAIVGCFKVIGKDHYFRNIKIINLSSAFTAIVLTEVALMSFASEVDTRIIDGIFGLSVGVLIVILGGFVMIAPKISIVDREYNIYKIVGNKNLTSDFEIQLTNSKFYGNYYYKARVNKNIIDGHIVKGKSPIPKWNIYVLILVIILSEILIFPYAIGGLVNYFKNAKLIDKLDVQMKNLGCQKILISEE